MAKTPWIKKASRTKNKGALHRQLGIPQSQKIPKAKLHKIVKTPIGKKVGRHTVTLKLKQRANFAINAQKRK